MVHRCTNTSDPSFRMLDTERNLGIYCSSDDAYTLSTHRVVGTWWSMRRRYHLQQVCPFLCDMTHSYEARLNHTIHDLTHSYVIVANVICDMTRSAPPIICSFCDGRMAATEGKDDGGVGGGYEDIVLSETKSAIYQRLVRFSPAAPASVLPWQCTRLDDGTVAVSFQVTPRPHTRTHTLTLSRSLSCSLSHSLSPSITYSFFPSHTRSLDLSLYLSLAHSLSLFLSLSLSLSLPHTHTHTLSLSLTHTQTHTHTLSLTHTQTLSRSLARSCFFSNPLFLSFS